MSVPGPDFLTIVVTPDRGQVRGGRAAKCMLLYLVSTPSTLI